MFKEHEEIALTVSLPEYDLEPGDVGTIVYVYKDGAGYEVEFFSVTGDTIAVAFVETDQVRALHPLERVHARMPKAKTA